MKSKYYEWTRELIAQGLNYSEIAKIQGRDQHNVRKLCVKAGLKAIRENPESKMKQQLESKGYVLLECNGGTEGTVRIKCKKCGEEMERVAQVARKPYRIVCKKCREAEQREKKSQREKQKEENKKQREREKLIAAKKVQRAMKLCPVCGNLFIGEGKKKYCSVKCQHNNKWMVKKGYRYLFPLEDVYKRDNGICWLCGEQCDWNDYTERNGIRIYGNRYPSRDHVVAKAAGGENSWENIRLAHRWCNSKRGIALM